MPELTEGQAAIIKAVETGLLKALEKGRMPERLWRAYKDMGMCPNSIHRGKEKPSVTVPAHTAPITKERLDNISP